MVSVAMVRMSKFYNMIEEKKEDSDLEFELDIEESETSADKI
jgi:hypothetical protein